MDTTEHLRVVKNLMVFSGTWRLKLNSKSAALQVTYNIYSICIQLYFVLFTISLIIELFIVWNVDKRKVVENLGVTIMCLIMLMKVAICQSKEIRKLTLDIIESERKILSSNDAEEKEIYVAHAKYTNKINLSLSIYVYGCVGSSLIIVSLINYIQTENMHKHDINGTHEKAPLPYVSWFPFDADKYYFIAFGMDIVGAFLGSTYNSVSQIFFVGIMIYVISRLKILQLHFKNFDSYIKGTNIRIDDHLVQTTLKHFILEHQYIIKYVQQLDESTKYLMLLEFIMNSFQVASLLIQFLQSRRNLFVIFTAVYLGMVIFQIFLLSWHANEVKEQSLGLAGALYDSNWYVYNESIKKCIYVMMMRSQRPLTLHIGPFYPMATDTAVSTMKVAYSYVTLLNKD